MIFNGFAFADFDFVIMQGLVIRLDSVAARVTGFYIQHAGQRLHAFFRTPKTTHAEYNVWGIRVDGGFIQWRIGVISGENCRFRQYDSGNRKADYNNQGPQSTVQSSQSASPEYLNIALTAKTLILKRYTFNLVNGKAIFSWNKLKPYRR